MNEQARALYGVPITLEGHSVLHQMFRVRWDQWNASGPSRRKDVAAELASWLAPLEAAGQSALFSVLGHKADLMLLHFRESFVDLNAAERQLSWMAMNSYLECTDSYLSVVELGLYESSIKLFRALTERGVAPHSDEWNAEVSDTMQRQKQAMAGRLFPKIPDTKYVCFYPMDRRRGEEKNWYTLPIENRGRQLNEHGTVGRRYADTVKQIITGSIGFDDWEWGVDLFANDPLVYKKLITEMRYDEVSAVFSNFGRFLVGIRVKADEFASILNAPPSE